MRLISLNYQEFQDTDRAWKVTDLTLDRVNLIVGKNASGKTRVLNVLAGLGTVFAGKLEQLYVSGRWNAIFDGDTSPQNAGERTTYTLEFSDRVIVSERLSIGRRTFLSRDPTGGGYLYAMKLRKNVRFQASPDQLIAVSRRDALQHPYLEVLHNWGRSVRHYQFGTDLGRTVAAVFVDGARPSAAGQDSASPLGVFRKAMKELPENYKQTLLADLDAVGYPCSDIGLTTLEGIVIGQGPPPSVLFLQEKDLPARTLQTEMSQGMFRVLAILTQVNAGILTETPQTILIDDIGEGLDFERSTNLIRLLVKKAAAHSFQLVMTTNDRFIMNAVPLEYWSVLHRVGGAVRVFNARNSRKTFDEFKYLGLNNFDFFTGQYFLSNTKGKKTRNEKAGRVR